MSWGNGLLPDRIKLLPKPMLAHHQNGPMTLISGQFYKDTTQPPITTNCLNITYQYVYSNLTWPISETEVTFVHCVFLNQRILHIHFAYVILQSYCRFLCHMAVKWLSWTNANLHPSKWYSVPHGRMAMMCALLHFVNCYKPLSSAVTLIYIYIYLYIYIHTHIHIHMHLHIYIYISQSSMAIPMCFIWHTCPNCIFHNS